MLLLPPSSPLPRPPILGIYGVDTVGKEWEGGCMLEGKEEEAVVEVVGGEEVGWTDDGVVGWNAVEDGRFVK